MLGYNDGGSGGKSANWYAATNGLAVTCAIICTLLGAPLLAEWKEQAANDPGKDAGAAPERGAGQGRDFDMER